MVFVYEISTKDVVTLGPRLYINKMNVQLAHVINDKNNIEIGILELGARYTLLSGSSACTVFAVSFFRLYSESAIIHMPGGDLQVEMNKDGENIQSGCNIDNEFMHDL